MPWSYVTLEDLKATSGIFTTGTATDEELRVLAEVVSFQIDQYCNRHFQPISELRTFDGPAGGGSALLVPDLISVGSLQEDTNMDGTYETTWAADDYVLEPQNAVPTARWGRPYTKLSVSQKSNGTQDSFMGGRQVYRIDGTWGFNSVSIDSGLNTSGSWDSTATALNVSGSASGTLEPGHTVLVDSEMMYITTTTGTQITVLRGAWGSTAGTHATTVDIDRFEYPPAIRQAAIMQAKRIWARKDSAYSPSIAMTEVGPLQVSPGGLDRDVRDLLAPYRKIAVGAVY